MKAPTLHVAAMPYLTPQGTQAAVRTITECLAGAGHITHLATYGVGQSDPPPIERLHIHRTHSYPRRRRPSQSGVHSPTASFRSGPSWTKLLRDIELIGLLRRLRQSLPGAVTVAHHVEAAMSAYLADCRPVVFVAHTALDPELPTYFPSRWHPLLSYAGRHVDRVLCNLADRVFAISPVLQNMLSKLTRQPVEYLPLPWAVQAAPTRAARDRARWKLGIASSAQVALYAGNLDAYQNWEMTVAAVVRTPPSVHLLVATDSDPGPLARLAHQIGIGHRLHIATLAGNENRDLAAAAADLAIVPRRTPGGLPIKLLDALSRGLVTVATSCATAGLPIERAAIVVDDHPEALARGIVRGLTALRGSSLSESARTYVAQHHSESRFLESFTSHESLRPAAPRSPAAPMRSAP